jgi:hypothetical protein
MGVDVVPSFMPAKLSNEKQNKIKYTVALDGRRLYTQQPTKNKFTRWRIVFRGSETGGMCGGSANPSFWER